MCIGGSPAGIIYFFDIPNLKFTFKPLLCCPLLKLGYFSHPFFQRGVGNFMNDTKRKASDYSDYQFNLGFTAPRKTVSEPVEKTDTNQKDTIPSLPAYQPDSNEDILYTLRHFKTVVDKGFFLERQWVIVCLNSGQNLYWAAGSQ
ncbi:hypothetical protein BGS_0219 [Beggiatoa sp. SS]|nr:hypothetical protein BGS_0219 [Beggiatoa sp. SS]